MARRKYGMFKKMLLLAVLVLAGVGAHTIWKNRTTQDGLDAAKQTVDKAERAVRAAEGAWK